MAPGHFQKAETFRHTIGPCHLIFMYAEASFYDFCRFAVGDSTEILKKKNSGEDDCSKPEAGVRGGPIKFSHFIRHKGGTEEQQQDQRGVEEEEEFFVFSLGPDDKARKTWKFHWTKSVCHHRHGRYPSVLNVSRGQGQGGIQVLYLRYPSLLKVKCPPPTDALGKGQSVQDGDHD
ncbi:hypothetical protein RUM43_010241 [Polyplax serrata]|uniref:Uncharacterized protein n=1 Tax=Polyplax serrata TaxID=468196 RepID=A0AAN8S4R8_POLSC